MSLLNPFLNGVLVLIYYFKKHFKPCFLISKTFFSTLNSWSGELENSFFDAMNRLVICSSCRPGWCSLKIKVKFNAFFSLGDPATQTNCYVSEGVSIDCGSAYCQEISGLFCFIATFSSHVNNQSWILNLPICFKIF